MTDPKPIEDWTPRDHARVMRARERGEPAPEITTEQPKPVEDMTPADHFNEIKRER